jgi:hypothetical protein
MLLVALKRRGINVDEFAKYKTKKTPEADEFLKYKVSAPEETPEPEGSHPFLDILAGLANAGRNLHNMPHDVVQSVENSTQGFGGNNPFEQIIAEKFGINKKPVSNISDYLPYDPTNYSATFGVNPETMTLMDRLIQGGVEHAPEFIGGGALLRSGYRRVKGTHYLDKLERMIKQKNIKDFAYPNNMIQQSKKFLPKTEATKELIAETQAGNYKPAFNLQSQVGHHQRKLAKSPLASENSIMAPKAGELKQNMLGHLEKVLRAGGNTEEADLLRRGISNYKQYIKIKDAAMPYIKYGGIPTTVLALLGLGIKKGKQLMND